MNINFPLFSESRKVCHGHPLNLPWDNGVSIANLWSKRSACPGALVKRQPMNLFTVVKKKICVEPLSPLYSTEAPARYYNKHSKKNSNKRKHAGKQGKSLSRIGNGSFRQRLVLHCRSAKKRNERCGGISRMYTLGFVLSAMIQKKKRYACIKPRSFKH